MKIEINNIKNINLPSHVERKLDYLGITDEDQIQNLVNQFIAEADTTDVDWYYFAHWVDMCYSEC